MIAQAHGLRLNRRKEDDSNGYLAGKDGIKE